MKCEIAKNNPVLMDEAIKHYLTGNKTTFTFESLWNDKEPYPKKELLKCLKIRIEKVEKLFSALPTIGNEMTLKALKKKYKELTQ
ncbi:hypothetical protein [uncultured Actinobacillus sp.]|uniref:hypothetical protein n=1 Tax=Glaesserella parasuis TaxID=738 RepID=UPI0021BEC5FF|nr:hypothetical protein [uncultured Actinobacillus sp.]MCT8759976.1 hypothetical protein [Glaesserella parasuis]MCT8766282.1 hypothetical protein [Glaesserella parasuis]MDO9831104.1 hypothetical protein [Glaesserella parasuis]MDP0119486.1 hypothetical protein [Glaesserella parasuis]